MTHINIWIAALITAFLITACHDDDNMPAEKTNTTTYKVAVIMPADEQERWERTAQWALDYIDKAQKGLTDKIKIELEWLDENSSEWLTLTENAAKDDSYAAIIGPQRSVNARKAAQICHANKRPLLLPVATSTEFQRIYAESDYIWNLSQSDITQCELLLTQAKLMGHKYVSLLAPDNDYGTSFIDWFAFQANELGLKVYRQTIYHSENDIRQMIKDMVSENKKLSSLIFVPGSREDALVLDNELELQKNNSEWKTSMPYILCTDMMFSASILPKLKYYSYEGVSPSAAPESGFDTAYETKFDELPICGEAHLFDALTMLAYALTYYEGTGTESVNDAILAIVDGRETWKNSWLPDDMHQTFGMLRQGVTIDLAGVTGDWTFDMTTHASVLNTTYCNWIVHFGKTTIVDYLSTDGSSRTTSTKQAWEWQTKNLMTFDKDQTTPEYPALNERWAVIVGASDDWVNYRHQADALAMYQMLKRHGYDDKHIILIMEDNLAYNKNNLYPGTVKVKPDGENIYHDVNVDYHVSDISPEDLEQILLGNKSERLPEVLESEANDNVIMFWCGHGNAYSLAWGSHESISGNELSKSISAMRNNGKFRKMFFALDACYSGTIGVACTGIPGLAVMTAANPFETSKASMKDLNMGIWLSNGFTRAFQDAIDENNAISIRDLYYVCARHTVGSHAMMYNIENYGNAFLNNMAEYLE